MYKVYVLYSQKIQKFYIGKTTSMVERIERHNAGRVPFTSHGTPWNLVWTIDKATNKEAIRLERKLKNLSGKRLLDFMKRNPEGLAGADAIELIKMLLLDKPLDS